MTEKFISEQIFPVSDSIDTEGMSKGEPGFPNRFIWQETEYVVEEILEKWKGTAQCSHGSKEMYLRKHWFKIVSTTGETMKIYFERQPKSKRELKSRWWLYSILVSSKTGEPV